MAVIHTSDTASGRRRDELLDRVAHLFGDHRASVSSAAVAGTHGIDALTGLPDAGAFRKLVRQALERAPADGYGGLLAIVDLDGFAFVNDVMGRDQGHRLLQEIACRLRCVTGPEDAVARLGRDRFGLLLPGVDGPDAVVPTLAALRLAICAPFVWKGCEMHPSATIGAAILAAATDASGRSPAASAPADALLRDARRALDVAKREDRGRWRVAHDGDGAGTAALTPEGRAWRACGHGADRPRQELRDALDRSELILHYQPRIHVRTGALAGAEALVRWSHPQRGLLKPAAFLPALEAAGLEARLFRFVLPRALAQAAAWRASGRPCRVAVNVGRSTLHHPEFESWVRLELERQDLNPALLELELTEGTPEELLDRSVPVLRSLRQSGVRISLDDFGVATASLAQLQRLPLDGLKIDKRFIDRLVAGSRGDREMVRAIVTIGKSQDLTVVAEGVETHAQRELLGALRCDEWQGYLYSRAVPARLLHRLAVAAD